MSLYLNMANAPVKIWGKYAQQTLQIPPPPQCSSPKYDGKIAALVNISYPGPTLTHQL